MTDRTARCSCGQLTAVCRGDPARVSVCHCLDCKRRTGSAFSYNATFDENQVETSGRASEFVRTNDEGFWIRQNFCPEFGTTVCYRIERRPGMITVPAGGFADPDFPEPAYSVYAERRNGWCELRTAQPLQEQ